jgi:hypothetical protein
MYKACVKHFELENNRQHLAAVFQKQGVPIGSVLHLRNEKLNKLVLNSMATGLPQQLQECLGLECKKIFLQHIFNTESYLEFHGNIRVKMYITARHMQPGQEVEKSWLHFKPPTAGLEDKECA